MKLTVIVMAGLLLAGLVAGVAVAQKASPEEILKDLDALTLRADNLSYKVESKRVDLNIVENKLSNDSVSTIDQLGSIESIAAGGADSADQFEAELSEIEKGLSEVRSRYDPDQYGNRDATAIERRMSYLENRIDNIRNMIEDIRTTADQIERQA